MSSRLSGLSDRIRQRYRHLGLGARLTLFLLPLILIPLLVMVLVTYQRARTLLRQQAINQLTSAAHAQIEVINEWSSTREQRLQLGVQRAAFKEPLANLILSSGPIRANENTREIIRKELEDLMVREGKIVFSEIIVARTSDSMILVSTQMDWEGEILPSLKEGTIQSQSLGTMPIFDDTIFAPGNLALMTSAPLRAGGGMAADSLLIGINTDLHISTLMQEMQVFWERRGVYQIERGHTYIVLAPNIMVTLERYGTAPEINVGEVHPVLDIAQSNPSGSVEYVGLSDEPVLGAYEWLPEWNLGVVVELPQTDIFAEINSLAPFVFILLLVILFLVTLIVMLATGRAIQPLGSLTSLAEQIAKGDWLHRVPETRGDEIGRLATSFNRMVDQLEESYRSLEDRVRARTEQIRTASEVARDAVAIRDTEELLDVAVNLISNRFGFYHVGVFLVDRTGENAYLHAASSEGGKKMLERGHSLPVGKVGLVGYVTGTGKSRVASDVGADAYHFANPDLPETRSEMALPLRSGDEVIGALDVQSKEPHAFEEEDALVLQIMADQLAVAIENARLIEEHTELSGRRRQVIEIYNHLAEQLGYPELIDEITRVVRDYLGFPRVVLGLVEGDEVVIRSVSTVRGMPAARLGESAPVGRGLLGRAVSLKSIVTNLETGLDLLSTSTIPTDQTSTIFCVPLISRGRAIGSLAITSRRPGMPEERDVEILELLAGQVAVSLENARLFEETQQSLEHVDALYRQQTAEAWEHLLTAFSGREDDTVFQYGVHGRDDTTSLATDTLNTPISLRGEIIGHLGVQSRGLDTWTEDEQAILEAVAEEVASALEQVRLMEEVQRRAAQLQTAAEIARDATGLLDMDTLLGRAINLIHDRFNFYQVSVFLIDDDGRKAVVRDSAGEIGRTLVEREYSIDVGSTSIIGYVTETGNSYVAHDVSGDPYYQSDPLLPETKTELGIPLKIGERVIGALGVQHSHAHTFSEDDVAVLEILADQLAVSVQNARLFEDTLRRADREQTLLDITTKIRASGNIDSMLQTAVHELRQTLSARRAKVHLFDVPAEQLDEGDNRHNRAEPRTNWPDATNPHDSTREGEAQ